MMKVTPLEINDVLLIEPEVFEDERGWFFESFNQKKFNDITGLNVQFVQDNHSKSKKGVLRGMHYQVTPNAQGKLVRVVKGEVFDVAVDIRKNSSTYGKWVGAYLSADNKKQLWIPEGFAHGFLTLSEEAEFLYKTTNYYDQKSERSLRWDDHCIEIDWPLNLTPIISSKDNLASDIQNAEVFE